MIRRRTRSTLFPYPTLFRSLVAEHDRVERLRRALPDALEVPVAYDRLDDKEPKPPDEPPVTHPVVVLPVFLPRAPQEPPRRSEEHTSELQPRPYLVCRLLLV